MKGVFQKISTLLHGFRQVPGTDHKPWIRIMLDITTCILFRQLEISLYFEGSVFLKGRKIRDFMSIRDFEKLAHAYNSPEYYPILEDKYVFDHILQGKGFRVPINRYIIGRGAIVEYGSDRQISQGEFLQSELEGFCKLINGYGGNSIYKISIAGGKLRVNNEDTNLAAFIHELGTREFLIQEKIHQHPLMDELNPSCLNTLRMITVQSGLEVVNFTAYLRVGINNNFVDNGLSGNIGVGLDKASGKLIGPAKSGISEAILQTFEQHPQTHTSFDGFEIPFYFEACTMTRELHRLFRQFFIIGWDIGITKDGPIVIEGNNITSLYSSQTFNGGERSSLLEHLSNFRQARGL